MRLGNQKLVLNVEYSDIEIYTYFFLFLRRRVSQQFENMHQFLDEKAAQVIACLLKKFGSAKCWMWLLFGVIIF